jgi:predicted nucleic acid-binding protein
VAALVDTNVLVYRFDSRDLTKQARAREVLRSGLERGTVWLPHQALLEFVAAITRPLGEGPLLPVTTPGTNSRIT